MIDYKTIIVTPDNIDEMRCLVDHPIRIGDSINKRIPWTIEYFLSDEGQVRSWAQAFGLAR